MKQYRTIERSFFAQNYYNYNGPAFRAASLAASDWLYNEAPRHTVGPVRIVAKVYTEGGKCRKIYKEDRNF